MASRFRPRSLAGQRIMITGAARGLGFALAEVLAARGARVSLVGLEPDLLRERAHDLGPAHVWFEADVTDQSALDEAIRGTVAALGGIDVVVANAGVASVGTLAGGPVDPHVRTIDVNVNGTIRTLSACLPQLIENRGYALLVGSVGSFSVFPGLSTYCASKAAIEHLANGVRMEVAHRGVRIGSAYPAFLDTDLVRDNENDFHAMGSAFHRLRGPLGEIYSPAQCAEELARAISKRKRRVYVPRSLAVMQVLRPVVLSRVGDAFLRRTMRTSKYLPALDMEVEDAGRAFGSSSVAVPAWD
ncbi:short-chain dehydrogenase [Rhodococcus sp. 06-621-2]|nr:short-chain dehydrogenase [Rhodococcus sp. 06-621-2]